MRTTARFRTLDTLSLAHDSGSSEDAAVVPSVPRTFVRGVSEPEMSTDNSGQRDERAELMRGLRPIGAKRSAEISDGLTDVDGLLLVAPTTSARQSTSESRAEVSGETERARAVSQDADLLFELAPMAYLVVNRHGLIERANRAAGTLLGSEPDVLVGASMSRFVASNSKMVLATALAKLFMEPSMTGLEVRLEPTAQGERVVAVTGSLAPNGAAALLTMVDVTENQRSAEAARAAHERYRRIVETTSEGVVITDAQATFTFVNERFAQLLGYSRDAIIGRSAFQFMVVEDHEKGEQRLEARRRGAPESYESRLRHRDGHQVWIRVTSNALIDTAGNYEGTLAVISDFTERRKAEETRLRLAAIVESSGEAIVGTDCAGVVTTWNRAAEQLYGYREDEVLGASVDVLLPPECRESEGAVRASILRGLSVVGHETTRRRKDGSLVEVCLTMSPIRDADGRIVGISKVAQDISARRDTERALRHAQEQLLQAQKMEAIGSLAGGIAHDFNNLLSVIMGYAGLLLLDTPRSAAAHHELTQILNAGQRAGDLTRQLLAFSRKQVQQIQSVDLNRCVSGLEGMLARLLGPELRVSVILDAKLARCRADPTQLEQVILNLAVNARDAMPQGGALTVQTANVFLDARYAAEHADVVPGSYVMLSVQDTGTGIDPAHLPRIFEPFFTTKKEDKGTGLGLATVYGIVKQSGGHVALDTTLGQGTTFRVYLPAADAAQVEQEVSVLEPLARRGTETVLLVDDDEAVRAATSAMLRRLGYLVHEAVGAGDAIVLAEQLGTSIKLVVTDIAMPHMDGRQLVQRLAPMLPNLRVLYISGHASGIHIDDALGQTPALGYLPKPFLPHELGYAVRTLLDLA